MDMITFPHTDISQKILLAIGIGMFVGLEREFSSKDAGVRSFSLAGLFGLIATLLGPPVIIAGLVCILLVTVATNIRAMLGDRNIEITTTIALLITYCLGALVGLGHVFTPVTAVILMTLLLAWKTQLSTFAHGLKASEIQSAVMLGLLTFVIYPILPDEFIDPWNLFNPKEAWMTVIILSGISFVNYVLLKIYSTRGLYYGALLGGAVNSSAAVSEIAGAVNTESGPLPQAIPILLMTTIAMFIRNLLLLEVLEPKSIQVAFAPLAGMIASTAFFIWNADRKRQVGTTPTKETRVSSPISLHRVLKFGVMFILLQAAGTFGQRYFGAAGVLSISFLGGLVSSASATAAAAKLASRGEISATVAGIACVLTSISSAFVNLPLVYRITRNKSLTRTLAILTFASIAAGMLLMAGLAWVQGLLH